MIPNLYEADETAFTSGGIGYLVDCTSCQVTEERNGVYECEFSYPVTGPLFDQIREGRFIFATHDESDEGQPFEIYARSEPIDGVVTFNAHHISYKLSDSVVMPFSVGSIDWALRTIDTEKVGGEGFTFWTDKTTVGDYELTIPTNVREVLGGSEGSLLDVYGGGEYEFDLFKVMLHNRRGDDTDVEIRYSKNLVDFTHEIDTTESYNAIVPYWFQDGEPSVLVTIPENMIRHDLTSPLEVVPFDMTDQFETQPSVGQLRDRATEMFNDQKPWIPSENFEIDFAALWQTEEYKQFAPLQRVKLCDTVLVYFPAYGIEAVREKVVKTVYNTLLDRFDEITLNQLPTTFSGTLSN